MGSGGSLDGSVGGEFALNNGAIVEVASGGSASKFTILHSSQEIVFSGGTDSGSTIGLGGTEILSGGTASGTLVSGAQQIGSRGGTAVAPNVQIPAPPVVTSGGTA